MFNIPRMGPALTYSFIFVTCGVFLCLFTVREQLRVGPVLCVLFALALSLLNYMFRYISWLGILPLLAVGFFGYTKIARVQPLKLVYILLVVITYLLFSNTVFYFFEGSSYTWGYEVLDTVLLGFATSMPLMAWFLRKRIWPSLRELKAEGFRGMWIIPTSFIAMNVLLCSSHTQSLITDNLSLGYTIMTTVFAVASAAVSFLMLDMLKKSQEIARVDADMRLVDMQMAAHVKRFDELTRFMDEVRILRHDMRHHMRVVQGLLGEGQVDTAAEYLRQCDAEVQRNETHQISENFVGDVIARNGEQQAQELSIADYCIQCALPAKCWIADTDLCIVLGNLMENALNACAHQREGRRYLHGSARVDGPEAVITMVNSCDPPRPVPAEGDETARREGQGIASIQAIARKYGGTAMFEHLGDHYFAAVLMYQRSTE